jgi:hypothetical protein
MSSTDLTMCHPAAGSVQRSSVKAPAKSRESTEEAPTAECEGEMSRVRLNDADTVCMGGDLGWIDRGIALCGGSFMPSATILVMNVSDSAAGWRGAVPTPLVSVSKRTISS